jgi:hypothetical protein
MSAINCLSRHQFPKAANEALDKEAAKGRKMKENPAAKREREFTENYDKLHPRPGANSVG